MASCNIPKEKRSDIWQWQKTFNTTLPFYFTIFPIFICDVRISIKERRLNALAYYSLFLLLFYQEKRTQRSVHSSGNYAWRVDISTGKVLYSQGSIYIRWQRGEDVFVHMFYSSWYGFIPGWNLGWCLFKHSNVSHFFDFWWCCSTHSKNVIRRESMHCSDICTAKCGF